MYSSISNHIVNFSHFLVAIFILFIICPRFLFLNKEVDLEEIISNYTKMILIIILVGYLLVFLKLFEFLSLFVVFILGSSYVQNYGKSKDLGIEKKIKRNAYVFNYLDGLKSVKNDSKTYFKNKKIEIKNQIKEARNKKILGIEVILLLSIIFYSAYLRFFDAYHFAAPAMSDGSVTLAWMKYIIERYIFHDGIYPQGFHIYLGTIQKIAFIDPLYILKYSGPFNGVLVTFGMYFFISRTTKEKAPAFIGATLYGILGSYLTIDWMRQAATNSQEFGYVFIFPTLYFTYKYLLNKEKKYLVNAFSGICITGLVHPIAYAFNVLGVAIMGIVACILHWKENFKTVWKVFLAGIVSVIISVTPMAIGWLYGKEFHGSSAEFLTEEIIVVAYPQIKATDFLAIISLILLLLYLIIQFKNLRKFLIEVYVLLLCIIAFVFYYYGGVVTQNAMIATRFSDLWALTCPVAIGYGIYVLLKLIRSIAVRWYAGTVFFGVLFLVCLFYLKPEPIVTYKMERNEEVEQYIKISSICNPTQWVIVSDTEGAYSQILGRGTHIRSDEFLKNYKSSEKFLYYTGSDYKIPDVFIYYDKKPFSFGEIVELPQRLIDSTKRREAANLELGKWITEYKEAHDNLQVFYEDDNFMIYRIQQEITQDETLKRIFNN